jgi:hypothetical protein
LPPSSRGLKAPRARLGRLAPPRDLASATDARTTRLLPSASCAVVVARLNRSRDPKAPPCDQCPRANAARVHRIPPRVRDDRDTPLVLGRNKTGTYRCGRWGVKGNISIGPEWSPAGGAATSSQFVIPLGQSVLAAQERLTYGVTEYSVAIPDRFGTSTEPVREWYRKAQRPPGLNPDVLCSKPWMWTPGWLVPASNRVGTASQKKSGPIGCGGRESVRV